MDRNPRSNLKHRPYTIPKGTGDSGYRYSTVDRRKSNMTRPKRNNEENLKHDNSIRKSP